MPGRRIALLSCLFFFLAGQFFVPLLGIEADEALFASPILLPKTSEYSIRIGHSNVALMLMSYLGTLKTWIYKPLLLVFGTGVSAVREPVLLAGAASIWLFYLLVRRAAGERAATIGCVLLATDTLYLLTSVFDWGPVVLQHLLILGGMLSILRFYQDRDRRALAGGFFLFGLAVWDKALALWMLSGLALATAALCVRELRSLLSLRNVAIAIVAFTIGALPFLVYNVATQGKTLSGNFRKDFSDLSGKARLLIFTLDGRGLIGYLTDESRAAGPAPIRSLTPLDRKSTRL